MESLPDDPKGLKMRNHAFHLHQLIITSEAFIFGKEEGTSSNGAATIPHWRNCKLMALVDLFSAVKPLHIEKSGIVETEKGSVPVMLQTTAAVHPGASGGAVVDSDGHMIGLITSNAKHGGGRTIPHLNFSIPCAALLPVFRFSDDYDLSMLKVLDEPNDLLSSVWSLAPLPSQSNQSISEKNDQEGKGSRFSKFLAEKHSGLEDLTSTIKEKLPSKL
ncbi:hypothetical protein BHE74_00026680 [Ensete ventricosum]|nr:hypothetical protein BHE74_00026680 [Ensete ventricosum]